MQLLENPFKATFSLDYLIKFWEDDSSIPDEFKSIIKTKLINHPELHGNITDLNVIEKNKSLD